jgi:uncharacterized lipoprotein NlpE involved in copper resistance
MKQIFTLTAGIFCIIACNNNHATGSQNSTISVVKETSGKVKHFKGAVLNGMKGDSLSFDLSADGKKISNLTFNGYWRCSGKLERQQYAGPAGTYNVTNGKVDGHISEPPDGGSTAWRFDLKATIKDNKASGTFRMNINNLGCDTYLLKFEASAK